MSGDDIASFAFLAILGTAVVGWYITQNRLSLSKTLQNALVWGFLFLGLIAAFGLWEDIRGEVTPNQAVMNSDGSIEVPRSPDGHYHLTLEINNRPVDFVVDTGATNMVLTMADARRVGLDPEVLPFIGRANTANGTVRTAPVELDTVALGSFVDRNVRAHVNEGDMTQSLLGMTYLQTWSRIEISNGALVLTR